MQCASCSESIEDDSLFCDMCGVELTLCPSCDVPIGGKWCTRCGAQGVVAASKSDLRTSSPPVSTVPQTVVRQVAATIASPTIRPMLRLRNRTLSLELDIADGAVLGRSAAHAGAFASFGDVSGKHCLFRYDGRSGWSVTDVGSTNGTRYNGHQIAVNSTQRLEDGAFLQIASLEFLVSIGSK